MLPLAWLVALAGTIDVVWNRVAVVALEDEDLALALQRTGTIWRNLGGVAGIVATTFGFWVYLRMAGFAGPLRRVQVAALAGLLLPALVLSALAGGDTLPGAVVLVAIGVGNTIVVLLGVVAGGYLRSPYREGVWGGALASMLVLILLVAATFDAIGAPLTDGSDAASVVFRACRLIGELVWLAAPVVVAFRWARRQRLRLETRIVAAVSLALVLGGALILELNVHPDYHLVAYGAFRLSTLPERAVALYALPIGFSMAVGVAALTTGAADARQIGVYLLTWVAAGFAPRTPIQVVYLLVASLSIARAVQASDPEGKRRAEMPWGEPPKTDTPTKASWPADLVDDGASKAGVAAEPSESDAPTASEIAANESPASETDASPADTAPSDAPAKPPTEET